MQALNTQSRACARASASLNANPRHVLLHATAKSASQRSGRNAVVTRVLPIAAVGFESLSDITALIADNPLVLGTAASVAAIGVVAGALLAGNNKVTGTLAAEAYESLTADPDVVLVDIRAKTDREGVPDLKAAKKKVFSVPYTSVVKGSDESVQQVVDDFPAAFAAVSGIRDDNVVVLIDADGSVSAQAATALAAAGAPQPKLLYVKGGAAAWQAAELPWKAAGLALPSLPSLGTLSLPTLDGAPSASAASAVAVALAATGAAAFVITEFELLLQLAGVVGLGVFAFKNLLFAEERSRTVKKVQSFLKDDIGADVNADELQKLAKQVLESAGSVAAAVAAPIEAAPAAPPAAAAPAPSAPASEAAAAASEAAAAKEWIDAWRAKTAKVAAEAAAAPAETVSVNA